jgi:hypothetical protein
MDSLVEKFAKLGIKNVKILALNIGEESINDLKIHYKARDAQLLDVYDSIPTSALNNVGKIRGVPACLVFNKEGAPVWGYLGGADYNSPKFINFIRNLANG